MMLFSCILLFQSLDVQAASPKLNKTSLTLTEGKTFHLKVKYTKKKVKYSSSRNSVATVSKKGKITAKKAGTVKIKAKVGKKAFVCRVKVKKKSKYNSYEGTYVKDMNSSVDGMEYSVTIASIEGSSIKFQVTYVGRNGSPLIISQPIKARIKKGKVKFSWRDTWDCSGTGVMELKNKKVKLKMNQKGGYNLGGSLGTETTYMLRKINNDTELFDW